MSAISEFILTLCCVGLAYHSYRTHKMFKDFYEELEYMRLLQSSGFIELRETIFSRSNEMADMRDEINDIASAVQQLRFDSLKLDTEDGKFPCTNDADLNASRQMYMKQKEEELLNETKARDELDKWQVLQDFISSHGTGVLGHGYIAAYAWELNKLTVDQVGEFFQLIGNLGGEIKGLDLSSNNLRPYTRELHNLLRKLTNLEELNINSCNLPGFPYNNIYFQHLHTVRAYNNPLERDSTSILLGLDYYGAVSDSHLEMGNKPRLLRRNINVDQDMSHIESF